MLGAGGKALKSTLELHYAAYLKLQKKPDDPDAVSLLSRADKDLVDGDMEDHLQLIRDEGESYGNLTRAELEEIEGNR